MIIEFTNLHAGSFFVVSVISFIVLKNYIHGSLILPISLSIIATNELNSIFPEFIPYNKYTNVGVYSFVLLNILVGIYILYKSTIEMNFKIITMIPLIAGILFYYARPYGEIKYPFLESTMAKFIPTMLFIGFLIGLAVMPENQDILRQEFASLKLSLGLMDDLLIKDSLIKDKQEF
jgi:hypothetical protein